MACDQLMGNKLHSQTSFSFRLVFPFTSSSLSDTELAAELKLVCGNAALVPPSEFMAAHTNFLSLTTHCSLLIFFCHGSQSSCLSIHFQVPHPSDSKSFAFSLYDSCFLEVSLGCCGPIGVPSFPAPWVEANKNILVMWNPFYVKGIEHGVWTGFWWIRLLKILHENHDDFSQRTRHEPWNKSIQVKMDILVVSSGGHWG